MSQSLSVWERLEGRVSAVAERTLRAYVHASPHYHHEVPDHLHRHMAHTCREFGRMLVRMARDQRDPRDDELRLFRERGWDRGAEGLPAADFLDAYVMLAEQLWTELLQLTGGEPPVEGSSVLLRCLRRTMHVAMHAHQQEFQAAHSDQREAVRAAVRMLADGEPVPEHLGICLANGYDVVALRFGEHVGDSVGDAVGQHLAGRRKVHRLSQQLYRVLGEDALAALDPDGGLVLVPSARDDVQQSSAVGDAVRRFQQLVEVEVTASFAPANERAQISAAVQQARALLDLATPGQVAV